MEAFILEVMKKNQKIDVNMPYNNNIIIIIKN
jgi:hypothetical protein